MPTTLDQPDAKHRTNGRVAAPGKTKTVVVTGASAGVGRAVARAFAKRGDNVAVLARGRAGVDGAARDVEADGGRALALTVDVSDPEAVERAADQIEEHFGPIDVWVNNAMASVFSPVKQMKPEEYKRVTEVTYLGTVYGSLTALKRMERAAAGTSFRSAAPWPTAAFRCKAPTAAQSTPSRAFATACGPSCCTMTAPSS